jgi:hypothetical protein
MEWVNGMLEVCHLNDYEKLTEFVDKLMQEGYCVAQVILMSTLSSSLVHSYAEVS